MGGRILRGRWIDVSREAPHAPRSPHSRHRDHPILGGRRTRGPQALSRRGGCRTYIRSLWVRGRPRSRVPVQGAAARRSGTRDPCDMAVARKRQACPGDVRDRPGPIAGAAPPRESGVGASQDPLRTWTRVRDRASPGLPEPRGRQREAAVELLSDLSAGACASEARRENGTGQLSSLPSVGDATYLLK